MNAEWLRYFVTLAETRNFHRAAERLHLTPQALSKAIAGLEFELSLSLVDRDHRVRGLTPAGEAFLEEAREVLQRLENAERRMAEWRLSEPAGPVTLAGDGLWHHYLLPPILAELVARHPRIRPKLYEMLPDEVEVHVATGEIDVGLLLRPPGRVDLDCFRGLDTPYRIAGRPGPLRSWQELGYIVPRFFHKEVPGSLDGWPEARFPRRIVVEVELLETALHLAEAGVGCAFVPELALRDRLARGTLAIVAEAPCEFADTLHVVWRRGIRPSLAAAEIIRSLGAPVPGDRTAKVPPGRAPA